MEYTPIQNLKPNTKNPRQVKKEDFEKLKKSLQNNPKLFEDRPCIASSRTGENVIIAGNTRYRAAVDLGWKEVPASIRDLTEEEEQEWAIRDNVNNGEWDFDLFYNEWDIGLVKEWGVDIPSWDMVDEIEEKEESSYTECPTCGHKKKQSNK